MTDLPIVGNKLARSVLSGMAGVGLALLFWAVGTFDPWEGKSWDWRASIMAAPGKATDDIRLILVDQASLDWGREVNGLTWPWPREIYGAILKYCQRNGAKAVAFDVLFTDPSKYGVEDDAAFAEAISLFGRVSLASFLSDSSGTHSRWPDAVPPPAIQIIAPAKWRESTPVKFTTYGAAALPVDELAQKSAVLANVSLRPDPDGVFRKVDLISYFDGHPMPSLGLGTYLAANPETLLTYGPGFLSVGEQKIPVDSQGYTTLRFRGPSGTHRIYSAAAVLQSEIQIQNGESPNIADPHAFKDKYVLLGFSAPGLYDLRPSPLSSVYPGAEIYATFLDNFLSDDFMHLPPFWLTLGLLFLLSFACAGAISHSSRAISSVSTIVAFISLPMVLSLGAYKIGIWLPLIVQEAAVMATAGLGLIINFTTEGRQKRYIKNAFRHFLSPAVIDLLIKHPDRLKLGGERRTLSIFFSDLQGFTSISEKLDPEMLVELLNDYLTAMTDIILEEGGTIDKYEGDAIIAFWNAPLDLPDHASRAVRAALRCQARLAEMRPIFNQRINTDMYMRIGVNTGTAVVGNLGSHKRFDYTMIGDAVNLAARLEGANKQFGTYTMMSQWTRDDIADQYTARELARLAVVGRKEPVTVFEPMTFEDYRARKDIYDRFKQGLGHFYEGNIALGLQIFEEIREHDAAASAYAEKCRALSNAELKEWQGVWVMRTK